MPGSVLGAKDAIVSQTRKRPRSHGPAGTVGKANINQLIIQANLRPELKRVV